MRKKSSERGFFVKILILSCNTGEGHNAAGHAVEEAALARGHEVNFVDAMQLGKRHTSRLISGLYIGIVKHLPWFFGFIYKLGMLISNRHFKSPVYWANAKLAKPLASLIEEGNYDIVVMPHLYPAETITYMKKHNMLPVKAIAIGTDYTCIPFWEETNCDYYVIPHEDLVDEYIKRGVPKEKLLPYGIPVRRSFTKHTPKDIARRKCHLDADAPTFLIMSGSMGFGKLAVFAMALYIFAIK
jgi:processive 1,2-diacylglycerol beta-glucosyltransferase